MSRKNTFDGRRGSALLIVLGMLSFMVVSAVGFSVYMRQGRLPSSYLRRNVASRHLVKAALANAIEDLEGGFMSRYDIGIEENENVESGYFYGLHDDPYPGIGDDMSKNSLQTGQREFSSPTVSGRDQKVRYCLNGDLWFKRVFCPFGLLPEPNNTQQSLEFPFQTAPTLTLEALAYLPPAIMDDVRKVSRLTRTALWHTLPYEAGRYAYTAVNVSDLFDINRLGVDRRDSAKNRVSLLSLCAQSPETPSTVNNGNVTALESIFDKLEGLPVNGNVTPFTSLADFNLVASGAGAFGYAPFMQYIGSQNGVLLQSGDAQMANALFVTDTYFPVGSATNTVYDLANGHQPFTDFTARGFLEVGIRVNPQDSVGDLYLKNLGIGLCALYDYLDSDNKPISLALPTTEAVPMIVGVGAPVGLQPTFGTAGTPLPQQTVSGLSGTVSDGSGGAMPVNDISITRTFEPKGISSFGNRAMVTVLATYPFKRMRTTNRTKNFQVRGLLRVYLAPAGMNCRVNDPNTILHPTRAQWNPGGGGTAPVAENGVATFYSQNSVSFSSFNQDIQTTDQAIDAVTLTFDLNGLQMPLYVEVKEQNPVSASGNAVLTVDPTQYKNVYYSLAALRTDPTVLRPLLVDGGKDPNWDNAANGTVRLSDPYPNGVPEFDPGSQLTSTYQLYASVWIQVMDGNNVVDMVPATVADDIEFLDSNVPDNGVTQRICGDGAPTLNFMGTAPFTYATPATALSAPPVFTWQSLYAVDPRFNYAPENWFATTTVGPTKNEWMTELGLSGSSSTLFGKNGHDPDIFMFVSDQEYLQSIGELQFLPALHDLDGSGTFPHGDLPDISAGQNPLPFSSRMGGYQSGTATYAHREFFWQTYTAYQNVPGGALDEPLRDSYYLNPYRMRNVGGSGCATVVSGKGSFKLNPFSDDNRVIGAAILGTPFDYYVASTNSNQRQSGGNRNTLVDTIDGVNLMTTYSFGQGSAANMSDTELTDIMDEISSSLSNLRTPDMSKAWASVEWQCVDGAQDQINDNNKTFLADDIRLANPLHGVDRKYLYSFWRECFDNSQQLFLIFVRAEPTSIGGGASGAITSAQLGGRAVALVWRDPTVPSGSRTSRGSITRREDFRQMKEQEAPHQTRVLFYHQFD